MLVNVDRIWDNSYSPSPIKLISRFIISLIGSLESSFRSIILLPRVNSINAHLRLKNQFINKDSILLYILIKLGNLNCTSMKI